MSYLGVGSIACFAKPYNYRGYLACDGSYVSKNEYSLLYKVIGSKYGENGSLFRLPNLKKKIPIHPKEGLIGFAESKTIDTYSDLPALMYYLTNALIRTPNDLSFDGTFEQNETNKTMSYAFTELRNQSNSLYYKYQENLTHQEVSYYIQARHGEELPGQTMENYVSEIRIYAGENAPDGWKLCDGTKHKINDYIELFSTIRARYGGDGRSTFALPDMRGRYMSGLEKYDSSVDIKTYAPLLKDQALSFLNNFRSKLRNSSLPSGGRLSAADYKKIADQLPSDDSLNNSSGLDFIGLNYIIAEKGSYPIRS